MENIMSMTTMERLSKDLKKASATLSLKESEYLVNTYYQMQNFRIATKNQVRALGDENPHDTIEFFAAQFKNLEDDIKKSLDTFSSSFPCGVWAKSIKGIGPVIAAGLLAHIDITKAPTAGHIWSYAGLDPTKEWKKGQICPHNRELKVLCWKMGESFVKQCNKPDSLYGQLYKIRKDYELEKNERGDYKDQAKAKLEKFNIGKDTDAYKAYSTGFLPLGHINQRAKRYAVKMFLSHLQYIMYVEHYGVEPPNPYAIDILNHAHKIEVPNIDVHKEAMMKLSRRI